MALKTLKDLNVSELKDLHHAEHQLLKALPKMAKAASSSALAKAFTDHLAETEQQIERLETIFAGLEIGSKGKKCKAMEVLLEEGKEVMVEDSDPSVKDAALIPQPNESSTMRWPDIGAFGRLPDCWSSTMLPT